MSQHAKMQICDICKEPTDRFAIDDDMVRACDNCYEYAIDVVEVPTVPNIRLRLRHPSSRPADGQDCYILNAVEEENGTSSWFIVTTTYDESIDAFTTPSMNYYPSSIHYWAPVVTA